MAEDIGTVYISQVPEFTDNADIQVAFELYHTSMESHLGGLESSKVDKTPDVLGDLKDLNTVEETGYYIQASSASAETGTNYPAENNEFYAGVLKVVKSSTLVFQEYHMIGETGNIINRVYRRIRLGGSWSTWEKSISSNDVISITDPRYLLKENTYTRTQANNAFAQKYFVETSLKTANYTIALDDLNKVVAMNVPSGGVLTVPTNDVAFPLGSVVNVYNANPTAFLEIKGADGVVVRNPGTIEPYQEASLRKRAANEWVAAGPVY
jgi:hypothetical protein